MAGNSQKFIARNRAPRVQIEYDVELYGSQKKVQLPFVMGVMSDLSGKSRVEQPAVEDRKFLEIDADNFDDRMHAMQPRAAFSVPNTLTGDGNLDVDLTFEKLADFEPGAIAAKIEPLRALLEARTQLSNLMAYMDGKSGAEALLEKILANPAMLGAISSLPQTPQDHDEALESLREQTPDTAPQTDGADDVLATLKPVEPAETEPEPADNGILDALRADDQSATGGETDTTEQALDALRAAKPAEQAPDTALNDALSSLDAPVQNDTPEPDKTAAALGSLASVSVDDTPEETPDELLADLAAGAPQDTVDDDGLSALDSLPQAEHADTAEEEDTNALLADLADRATPDAPQPDEIADVLADMPAIVPSEPGQTDATDDLLSTLADAAREESGDAGPDLSALDGLADVEVADAEADPTDDLLADLADAAAPEAPEPDDLAAALDSIPDTGAAPDDADASPDDLLAELSALDLPEDADADDAGDVLSGLSADAPDEADDPDLTDDLLADLAGAAPDDTAAADIDLSALDALAEIDAPEAAADTSDDLLADLAEMAEPEPAQSDPVSDALEGLSSPMPGDAEDDATDDILAELDGIEGPETPDLQSPKDIDATDAVLPQDEELDDLDGLLNDLTTPPPPDAQDPLDDLLGDLAPDDPETDHSASDDLAGLLDDLTPDAGPDQTAIDALDDLLGDLDEDGEAEGTAAAGGVETGQASLTSDPEFAFGVMSSDRPDTERLRRKRFRMAVFGDFSGRSARGIVETGDALAARRPILLDPDTAEDVISGFATTLVLPIGKDGAGVEVKLGGLDDLHPDELYENVDLFSELVGLRGQLGAGATAEQAATRLREWSDKHGTYAAPTRSKSSGNAVPADKRLSDFQRLIGDTTGQMTQPSPVEDLLARVVGPHIRAVPDADAVAMQGAVDDALAAAMRLILHHPEFQSIEAQWRSVDLIARSVETDDTLDVMLYDISAEEIAADLAAADELSQSGIVRLLTEDPLDEENGRGGYSALLGLYTFEETPPHAELLGRIARVAAHVDAPFFAAMSPGFMATDKQDRHPLVAQTWDSLRAMPEAGHLGLVTPRFMLRRPYGAKTEPIYEFEFEEFTMKSGLAGLLWANPVVLVAILLAKSFKQNGAHMNLGSVMSLGEVPYHFVTDRYGDQVQLPCTERNLTQDKVEKVMARGFMPVVSVKGRDEIRLASFQAVGGGEILGPWSGVAPPDPSPPRPAPVEAADAAEPDGADDDLDALLAGFDDSGEPNDTSDADIDADLAALLDDL